MSATLNQAQFSSYFGGAPCIEIPGFTHPVQDHYAEDILPHLLTDHNFQPSSKPPAKKANQAQLDRMRSSFMERGVNNERTLMALENLTRSEKIDFGLVGATVSLSYCCTFAPVCDFAESCRRRPTASTALGTSEETFWCS